MLNQSPNMHHQHWRATRRHVRPAERGDIHFAVVATNSVELGVKLSQDKFCREFTATTNVAAHLQEYRRMIRLMFKRRFLYETIVYQVEMKFQDMEQGCIQVAMLENSAAVTLHLRFPTITGGLPRLIESNR